MATENQNQAAQGSALQPAYACLKIRSAMQKDDPESGLSFFEAERDIPFAIRRMYTILESEQPRQQGFFPDDCGQHLLFCPFGAIEVLVDAGKTRRRILLERPYDALLLQSGVWRELRWKTPGSVLCVAASDRYDPAALCTDASVFQEHLKKQNWTEESAL